MSDTASDPVMEALQKLRKENEQLKKENEDLKKQIEELKKQQGASGQSGQSSKPTEKQAVILTAAGAKAKLGKLIAGTAKANLRDSDGAPIKGQRIVYLIDGVEAGYGTTDANGDATMTSGQYLTDFQSWGAGLGNGYTVEFRGNKDYLPQTAHGSIGVTPF